MSLSAAPPPRAEIVVDAAAIRHNLARLRALVGGDAGPAMMAVVKADGYGHGILGAAAAAREAGAEWLGVATLDEALALREFGDLGRVLCWLVVPGEDYRPAIAADIDVAAYSVTQLAAIEAAAVEVGLAARVHLKVDTGLSRGGAPRSEWDDLIAAARRAQDAGALVPVGIWSHFACSDEPDHPANDAQEAAFREAVGLAEEAGLALEVRHLANSAGALLRPGARFDLVRFGIATYGLNPAPGVIRDEDLGLVPAMTVRATVLLGKDLDTGAGVSYGHTYVVEDPVRVALVPLGYGDGVPRHASSTAQVQVNGARGRVLGRICMDQFVVEAPAVRAGDEVVLFGTGQDGAPTAQDWAEWCGTISYEVVTRIGGRAQRTWTDSAVRP